MSPQARHAVKRKKNKCTNKKKTTSSSRPPASRYGAHLVRLACCLGLGMDTVSCKPRHSLCTLPHVIVINLLPESFVPKKGLPSAVIRQLGFLFLETPSSVDHSPCACAWHCCGPRQGNLGEGSGICYIWFFPILGD